MSMSLKLPSVMYCPSRMMVTLSTIWDSSSSLCEMYTIPLPSSLSFRMIRKRSSISFAVREDVGSSMIRILASMESAFAISTICCLDTGRSPTIWSGLMSIRRSSRTLLASFRIFALFKDKPPFTSLPRNMFSVTVKCLHMFNSWWIMATPASWACFGVRSS